MKKTILSFLFLTTLFFTSNAQQLEVAGAIQSDSLTGTNSRVVQTNATGEMSDVPAGNLGDVLSQGTTGVEWKSVGMTSSTPCAPTYPCPTEFSTTSAGQKSWGACRKDCANLTEGGHDDWRLPTLDEAYSLFNSIPIESSIIWTEDLAFYEVLNGGNPMAPRRVNLNLENGDLGFPTLATGAYCKCVR